MAEDLGEKTEAPTPRRLREAREEGNVARSMDLAGALMLTGMSIGLMLLLVPMFWRLAVLLERLLDPSGGAGAIVTLDALPAALEQSIMSGILALVPILVVAWLLGWLSQVIQVGWLFSPASVKAKFQKLNPINGFKRIFGLQAIVKASLDSMKVLVVALVVTWTIWSYWDQILVLPTHPLVEAFLESGWMLFGLAMRIVAILLILGLLDFAWQRWKHARDLRMTKQQVKDEFKQTDGDPDVKRRRMQVSRQLSLQRIATDVPKADVVVTNPEHLSIAIAYDPETMVAPRVLAKGADLMAMRIRQIAQKHGIPVIERKPLARAIYSDVPVGGHIPEELYTAVAELLAHVYQLSGKVAS
ncbi:MAG: flagellar biosynthesis protein FlhB [Phycisphaerae bacterium]|nr:flagellar biosynthesis protein FlhB [Phycisphaerae bacterium]